LQKKEQGQYPAILTELVSSAAVIRVVMQRFSPTMGEKRCMTTLIMAAEETRLNKLGQFINDLLYGFQRNFLAGHAR